MMEWGVAARVVGLGFLAFVLASCAQTQLVVHAAKAVKKSADALASTEEIATLDAKVRGGHYKIGDPYEVEGVRYHPRVQPNYAETGVASWYGKPFHGRRTANVGRKNLRQQKRYRVKIQCLANSNGNWNSKHHHSHIVQERRSNGRLK